MMRHSAHGIQQTIHFTLEQKITPEGLLESELSRGQTTDSISRSGGTQPITEGDQVMQPEKIASDILAFTSPASPLKTAAQDLDPRSSWSLTRCYDEWIAPDVTVAATASDHRTGLRHWTELMAGYRTESKGHRTERPASPVSREISISEIDYEHLEFFRRTMLDSHSFHVWRKANSIVRVIIEEACRRKVRDSVPPKLRQIRRAKPIARAGLVTLDEVTALYQSAHAATWPRIGDLEPGFVWQTWILMFWLYGV